MRISVFSALYPPDIIGGAEISADNLNRELIKLGHSVSVLTTASQKTVDAYAHDREDVLKIRRQAMNRPYPALDYSDQPEWKKAIWHLQDHFDGYNYNLWASFIEDTSPDVAIVQVTQGLGFNGLKALADKNIPTIYILHDLSLACYRTSMFKNGHSCKSLCLLCKASNAYKVSIIKHFSHIGFVSPSLANLRQVGKYVPIDKHPSRVILNPITYPKPKDTHEESDTLRLLYVGQITESKGVEFLIKVFKALDMTKRQSSLTIVGSGPELDRLKNKYCKSSNIVFTGKISFSEVADHMENSDFLCTPSIWFENSPGVVIQALSQGLPVIASQRGGITEIIEHNKTGLLLEAQNHAVWLSSLQHLLDDPEEGKAWRVNALNQASRFSADNLAMQYEAFIKEILASSK